MVPKVRCLSTPWDIYPAVNKRDEFMKAYRILGGLQTLHVTPK